MADDTDDASNNEQIKVQMSNRPAPPSPSASTNNESTTTIPLPNSPPNFPPMPTDSSVKATHLDSQPMTKSSSSSSMPSVTGTSTADVAGPSPYGTRSRNRTGNARPNYAEDRELDAEFESGSGRKPQAGGISVTPSQAQPGENDKSVGVSTRRSSTTISGPTASKATATNVSKDGLPGMSSFSLNPDPSITSLPVTSKKRKTPGSGVSQSATLPTSGHSVSHGTTRRATTVASSGSYRETNMLSFENCKGYLKNGKLKADDGTILGVNGKSNQCATCKFQAHWRSDNGVISH